MKKTAVGYALLILVVLLPIAKGFNVRGIDGGSNCAWCTIIVGLVGKLSLVYNETTIDSLERLCNALPSDLKPYCKTAVDFLGKFIDDKILL